MPSESPSSALSKSPKDQDAEKLLSSMQPGEEAILSRVEARSAESDLLGALGLEIGAQFRLCKTGAPWILQVGATRIGVAAEVTRHLFVRPVTRSAS